MTGMDRQPKRFERAVLLLALAAAAMGCKDEALPVAEAEASEKPEPEAPAPRDPALLDGWRAAESDDERAAITKVETGRQALLSTLAGRLANAIGDAGGLVEAANLCATEAQVLTEGVAKEHGVALGRTSKKLRNGDKNQPPAWVVPWLEANVERKAADATTAVGIVDVGGKTYARTIAPLGVKPLCLNCHGPEANIPAEVKAVLAQHYPSDAATGYAIGDLRGAVWAEVEVVR